MLHGIINVYKEPGFTSFDVVAKLRGIVGQKKIGHTGTLDPAAQGVLPVCFGNGTKLCDMLTDRSKEYEAVLLLGVTTDTLDMEGTVQERKEVNVTEEQLRDALKHFEGEYDQVPPMYSACKVNGKRLYELAREGISVERKARRVTIEKITVLHMELPRVTFRVSCSKGTYIRSLCQDIGDYLGCGGCMESLLRTRSGQFTLDSARKLGELQELKNNGKLESVLIPIEEVLRDLEALHVKPEFKKIIDNGNPLLVSQLLAPPFLKDGEKYRIYNAEGQFCASYFYSAERDILKPDKMFPPEELQKK